MSNDKTPPFDIVAAFQQLLQGHNEIMCFLSKVEGRLLPSENPSKIGENHRQQSCATGSTQMHVFTADLVSPTQQMDVCTADLVTPTQKMHVFTAGLSDSLRTDVKLDKPLGLHNDMNLARTTPIISVLPKPPEMLVILSLSGSGPNQRSLCRLNPTKMAERRQKGLCFNCDEQYTKSHKWKLLFFLLVMNDDEYENSSLLTIHGAPG